MRAVAAIPAIGLLAGSAVGFLFPEIVQRPAHALLIGCGVVSVLAWRASRSRVVAVAVGVAFAAGGALLAADAWQRAWRPTLRVAFEEFARAERAQAAVEGRVVPEDDEAFAIITGVLRSDASPAESGVSLSVGVDGIAGQEGREGQERREGLRRVEGGILVTVVGSLALSHVDGWRASRRIRMPVQLRRPARHLDPGVADNERALARRGTTLVGSVKSGALVEMIEDGHWWDERAADVRVFARRAIARAVGHWSPQSAAIVTAIAIGDRAGLSEDVQRRLQGAGTYHVIAISGGNIAIFAGLLLAAFRLAGVLGRVAMLSAIVALAGYGYLVGGGASVDRATLMAVVYFGGRAFDQRSPALNTLWIVAGILVAIEPLSVTDPAFALTFGATLGILVSARPAQNSQKPRLDGLTASRLSRACRGACSALHVVFKGMFIASVAAEVMLFPVGALVFSRVTFAGLALNFLAIPLMGVAQVAGMVVVPAALVSLRLASLAGWIAHVGAGGLVWSADLLRFAPMLTYRVAPPAWTAVFMYYASLVLCWALWRRRLAVSGSAEPRPVTLVRRTAFVVAAMAAVWILAEPWALWTARGDGRLHVTFLDVGQGDSLLVRFPRGSTMLVDAGGLTASSSFDIGDRVIAPVLRGTGIRDLDYVVLTHGDPDHIGGAPSIVREFRPREVWEGIPVPRLEPLMALRLESEVAGAHWANVYSGDRISVDGVEIAVRHPMPADWERQKVRNDDSIVLEVRWHEVSILLTGDIGKAVERTIASAIPSSPLRVLKVPHHGSLTSSSPEFLRAIRPEIAVFSAGRANHFGHPAREVLQRYRDIGAAIFRTDQDGAVSLDTDGHSIEIHTFTGRRLSLN